MLWEYMTAGNETPAFQSDRGTSGPHRKNGSVLFQGSELEGSHVDQESVKSEATTHGLTRDIIKKDTSMLESPRKLSENPGQGLNQTQFRHSAGLSRLMGIKSFKNGPHLIDEDVMPEPVKINSIVGSSVQLNITNNKSYLTMWQFYSDDRDHSILKFISSPSNLQVGVYFKSRVTFHRKTGSISMKKLRVQDSGMYQGIYVHHGSPLDVKFLIHTFVLNVQEKLRVPRIVQTPIYTASHVQLMCIVDKGIASSIVWLKDDMLLKSPQFQVEGESSTVYIKDMEIKHCGMYTCIVKNEVSTNSNSYFLTAEEILFILICVALISIVALVSGLTTFIATVVIIITLTETQDPDRQNEVTTIFMVFQLVSIISLLIACVLSVFESGLSLWCRTTAGFGCFLSLAVIIYISILYVGLNTDEFQPFLSRKIHRCIILICEILCVAISVSLIQQSIKTVQEDDMHVQLQTVRHATQQRLLAI
ncbi:uncharacterized protein [Scyliorhinus torazame]|uniref:uncharacterized protein isoform X2 n=1 Tax=Scyliorhinus torazame TaxID=75743 RepID=UPI003B58E449